MNIKKSLFWAGLLLVTAMLTSCAPAYYSPQQYGFLYGLLHGAILPIAIVGKIFGMDHNLYALNNSGFWYWLAYFLGLTVWIGGGSAAGRKSKKQS